MFFRIQWIALVLFALSAHAQTVTGLISGTVLDKSAMPVTSARVVLTEDATGYQRTAQIEGSGDFVFASIMPGNYTVTVQAEGFKKYEKTGIRLTTSERLSAGRIVLEIGTMVEKIVVEAQTTPVEVENSDRSGLITAEQMERQMTRNRNLLGLVAMLPGAVLDDSANILEADNTGTAPTPVFGGVSNAYNTVTVDGVNSVGNNTQYFNAAVTMEAVAEVKVLPNNFKAEYGRSGGAMIVAVTKQGSSQYRGSAFYYMRNEALNANSPWSKYVGTVRPKYRYNTFGGSFGGPVPLPGKGGKNKLFFLFSEEAQPRTLPQSLVTITTPTVAERAGDFTKTVDTNNRKITVTDPLAGAAFPDNMVPASRIYTPAQNLLKVFPEPNFFNTAVSKYTYNYVYQESPKMNWHQEVIRLDYNTTDKLKLYGRAYTGFQPNEGYFAGAQGQSWPFLYSNVNWQTPAASAGGTYTLNPNTVVEFSLGFIAQSIKCEPGGPKGWDAVMRDKLGVGIGQIYPKNNPWNVVPTATFSSVTNAGKIGVRGDFPDKYFGPRSNLNLSVSRITGTHTFKAGIYVEKHRYTRNAQTDFTGTIAFTSDSNNPLNTGYAYSNALTGTFQQYSEADQRPRLDLRSTVFQWYLQDTWKVTRRLTLDFGSRFSWAVPYHQADGLAVNWDPSKYSAAKVPAMYVPALNAAKKRVAQNPLTGEYMPLAYLTAFVPGSGDPRNGMVYQSEGMPTGFLNGRGVVPAPRFGFAWDVNGDGKTAVRGGIGYTISPVANTGFTGVSQQVNNLASSPTFYYGTLDTIQTQSTVQFPSAVTALNPDLKLPSMINYSFGVQRDIGFGTVIDAAYVASIGRHNTQSQNPNMLPYGTRFLAKNIDSTTNKVLSDTYLYPYRGYGSIVVARTANSNYQSMQLQANRRFSHGLQYGASYTWSKTLGYTGNYPNFVDNRLNYGKTSYNRDHTLTVNWLYDVPQASKLWSHKLMKGIGDGWQMSGIAHFQVGRPLSVTHSRSDGVDAYGGGDITNRPMQVANANLSRGERTFSQYFNAKAFALPAIGQIGTVAVDAVTGPGKNNWDLSLYKNFKLREKKNLQFRWELYNAFNHASWSGVNTTARFNAAGEQINATFGQITGSAPGRIMQAVLRLSF